MVLPTSAFTMSSQCCFSCKYSSAHLSLIIDSKHTNTAQTIPSCGNNSSQSQSTRPFMAPLKTAMPSYSHHCVLRKSPCYPQACIMLHLSQGFCIFGVRYVYTLIHSSLLLLEDTGYLRIQIPASPLNPFREAQQFGRHLVNSF